MYETLDQMILCLGDVDRLLVHNPATIEDKMQVTVIHEEGSESFYYHDGRVWRQALDNKLSDMATMTGMYDR